MIELVFVIIVIGILSATIIPRIQTNPLQEAAIQLVSDIRYTQHLALVDDKYDNNDRDSYGRVKWFRERWQINFGAPGSANSKYSYTIYSDSYDDSTGDPDDSEIAKNPQNKSQIMTGGCGSGIKDIRNDTFQGMKKMNIGESYGISNVIFSRSCTFSRSKRLYFDHLGRPMYRKLGASSDNGSKQAYEPNNLLETDCIITLVDNNDANISLAITAETGYVKILF